MSETHTYTVHLGMAARDDRHAWEVAQKVKHLVEQYWETIEYDLDDQDRVLTLSPSEYVIDSVNVTDSDDWGEHVPVEDVCHDCGRSAVRDQVTTNRTRNGSGGRVCLECLQSGPTNEYRIEDVLI